MKTAISIPTPIFSQAETMAGKLGMSRSELYSRAVEEYVKKREEKIITEKLNEIYSSEKDKIDDDLYKLQFNTLKKEKW